MSEVTLTLSRETVETIRSSTRSHLRELEKLAERAEARGVSGMYWRTCATVVEEGLTELEDRYGHYLTARDDSEAVTS